MSVFDPSHFLNTPRGQSVQFWRRRSRRIYFTIKDVEPRRKNSMADGNKDGVQTQLLEHLVQTRRRAFRGPVALKLDLQTTADSPTHSHNIAKNLLDLFALPRPALKTGRQALLYANDAQVHALCVTCSHGKSEPLIRVVASPIGCLRADLEIIWSDLHQRDRRFRATPYEYHFGAIDRYQELVRDKSALREIISEEQYESFLLLYRRDAQE